MRITVMMKMNRITKNTTMFSSLDDPAPMRDLYINSKCLESARLESVDTVIVVISTEPITTDGVILALPPVPFYKLTQNTARYEHRDTKDGKDRPSANTRELPVTRVYVDKSILDDKFIAERMPIFFGVSGVMEKAGRVADIAAETAGTASVTEVVGETGDSAVRAAFDAFLRESVRVEEDGKITTRQIWRVWAARWGDDPDEPVIAGIRYSDVAGRVRAILGVVAAKNPTRVDGRLQRYWSGYAI